MLKKLRGRLHLQRIAERDEDLSETSDEELEKAARIADEKFIAPEDPPSQSSPDRTIDTDEDTKEHDYDDSDGPAAALPVAAAEAAAAAAEDSKGSM